MNLKHLLQSLVDLFYPPLCDYCLHPLLDNEEILCLHCVMALPRTGFHHQPENETTMRIAGRFRFQHATSFLYFTKDGITQHLLHAIKYGQRKKTALYLSKLFARELAGTTWYGSVDTVIAVPLHSSKQRQRGFNQSELIAGILAEETDKIFVQNALIRVRKTQTQTLKSRHERLKNLENAFQVDNVSTLQNKHLLLIDDVLTTGATIEACALALLQQVPGVRISIATLAIAHQ